MLSELSGIYHKKVRVKNPDGTYRYELRTYSAPGAGSKKQSVSTRKSDKKFAKAVNKLIKPKSTRRAISPTDWQLMELRKERKDVNAKFKAFYEKYPRKKPKTNKPRKSAPAGVPCSNGRYAKCEATVYTYANGNRKIVTMERVANPTKSRNKKSKSLSPKKRKHRGVADIVWIKG